MPAIVASGMLPMMGAESAKRAERTGCGWLRRACVRPVLLHDPAELRGKDQSRKHERRKARRGQAERGAFRMA